MGKVTKVEIINVMPTSEVLTARVKKKGKTKFSKPIILKGKGAKEKWNKKLIKDLRDMRHTDAS